MRHKKLDAHMIAAIRTRLRYEPDTGKFYWLQDTHGYGGFIPKGYEVVGKVHDSGHILIGVRGQQHRAHHLAWILYTGRQLPQIYEIHHKNDDPADNRWTNLEAVTRKEHLTYAKESASDRNRRNWQSPAYRAARAAAFADPDVIARRSKAIKAALTPELHAKSQTPEARAKRAESMRRRWSDPEARKAQSQRMKDHFRSRNT